jgi:hypothetical protein
MNFHLSRRTVLQTLGAGVVLAASMHLPASAAVDVSGV